MRIRRLIDSISPYLSRKVPLNLDNFEVKGISCNSKNISDDFVFVAIKGAREDGNKFINEAIAKGARAVFYEGGEQKVDRAQGKANFIPVKNCRKALGRLTAEFYGNASSKIKVVGVTGTNGKTTITYLLEAILKRAAFIPAVIGTINYRYKNSIFTSTNTTPGPVELQSMLAAMLKEGINYVVMEVSSHALDQDRTEGVNFHSAIFTNLTQDHLDYHKTLKNYFLSKAKLFKNISQDSFAVINNDDKYSGQIKKLTKARLVTYGIKNKAQVSAKNIRTGVSQIEFLLATPGFEIKLKTRLIGIHNIYNILACVSWAIEEGIDSSIIKSAIEKFDTVPGRLEKIHFYGGFSVFVDYAHTEDALRNAIKTLKGLSEKKLIVVFGCGGERDKAKRPKMGRVVSDLSDYAIITNDNPRSEDPVKIIKDIKRGIKSSNYCIIPDRLQAIKKSLSLAKTGDIVLIAGKGHENYQIIKDKVIHFNDREEIKKCLKSMN